MVRDKKSGWGRSRCLILLMIYRHMNDENDDPMVLHAGDDNDDGWDDNDDGGDDNDQQ